ncbi:hypothetical protein HAX54_031676, partial [Datura stramonium]|nr:hypothetical protein [Datura stramonium]
GGQIWVSTCAPYTVSGRSLLDKIANLYRPDLHSGQLPSYNPSVLQHTKLGP